MSETAHYVYGVVPSGASLPDGLTGVAEAPIVLLESGDLALLASPLDDGVSLETRENLLAHARVLDTVALGATALPMRYGTVVDDADEATREILDEGSEHFTELLAELDGTVQFTLTATYVEEAVLAEVTRDDPAVAELAEATRDQPPETMRDERIRLGELVVKALAAKREGDADALLEALEPHAAAIVAREPGSPDIVLDAALLVRLDGRDQLENAIEKTAGEHAGRVRLRVVGPRAPYDFVPEE